ncbi:MAG: hypothetical protein ACU85U_07575 [Gammaproteobacteria bacterium]|jgi:hypothetical protein
MMRRLTLLLLCAICGQPSAGNPPDSATTVRATVLRDAPARASTVVRELAADVELDVFARERLWVKAAPSGAGEAEAGWLRFTEVRYSTTAAPAATQPVPAADAGGFAGFSRSVSGFLRGFGGRTANSPQATSTIGIRGLTVADLEAAHPDQNALALVDRYAISKADAEQFAGVGGLTARDVDNTGGQR